MRWPPQPRVSPWVGRIVRTVIVMGLVLGATSASSRWQAAALAAAYVVHVVTTGSFALAVGAGFLVVWLIAVIGIGTAVRFQLDALAARREQADEHRHRLAEQERLRIAREVHDVVAHSLA